MDEAARQQSAALASKEHQHGVEMRDIAATLAHCAKTQQKHEEDLRKDKDKDKGALECACACACARLLNFSRSGAQS